MTIWIPRLAAGASAVLLPLLVSGCGENTAAPATPAPPVPADAAPSASVPPEATAWLDAHVEPFAGAHLSLPHDDLEFLRDLVGGARIVSLGEATHGTREFFEMKARILRFLVEEMDFDTFAIEADWPAARRLDRYVRTGVGDPRRLLSGFFLWPWRTESVLEMIEWMREHNRAGGDVGFHGVDMQFPGMPLHDLREYTRSVDAGRLDSFNEKLDCLGRFANEPTGLFRRGRYRDQTEAYRSACGRSLEEARALLSERRGEYETTGGAEAFTVALQSLRVAFQYHSMDAGEQSRDESMAENTVWLSEQVAPEGRIVLWAHNYHVSTQPGAQGHYLRRTFGDDMVVLGFSHENGRFTAVGAGGSRYLGRNEFVLDDLIDGSFEAYFATASAPRFVLDLRRPLTEPGNSWLAESRPFRTVGAGYDGTQMYHWRPTLLAEWYDGIIHFRSTRPTATLPYRPPTSF